MKLFFIALVLSLNFSAFGQQSFCGNIDNSINPTEKNFKYCVDLPTANIDYSKVIYFFHGIYGSELTWFEEEKYHKVRNQMLSHGRPLPPIVTISFGKTWLVSRKQVNNEFSGLYEQIINQVFPFIEQQVLGVQTPKRLGFGMSMGGFNMVQVHLHSPNLFHKIALTCPAMANESPYAARDDIKNYIFRNDAKYAYVWKALKLSRKYFASTLAWEFDSPLKYLEKFIVSAKKTEFYISAVTHDEFGFTEGDVILANRLHHQGFKVKWEFVRGQHCDINPISVANFLMAPIL